MNALYAFLWIFALWKWGDWRNWKMYYPTFLFYILGDFLYLYLLSDFYPMWTYDPQGIDEKVNLTNTHVSFSIMAVKYPVTILIYLYRFPGGKLIKKLLYILKYDNGWSLKWSILFNAVMFTILRVHHKRPAAAWGLSIFSSSSYGGSSMYHQLFLDKVKLQSVGVFLIPH
ncbi:hypothetical protein [Cytobacillus firmus]|uniref:hypothetical protein n=1 Tax=Cytobacillus firmus TaxID=1399 RepID=UPI002493FE8F|nr:hypothetical protein [Cytobacillus firmus]